MASHLLLSEAYAFTKGKARNEEHALEYTPSEMAELFTPEENKTLAEGGIVTRERASDLGTYVGRYVSMVVAARNALNPPVKAYRVYIRLGADERDETFYAADAEDALRLAKACATAKERRWAAFFV
jgi:hypothetical protein